jgi:hypothetical protein
MTGERHRSAPEDDPHGPAKTRRQAPQGVGDRDVHIQRLLDASFGHGAGEVAALALVERG